MGELQSTGCMTTAAGREGAAALPPLRKIDAALRGITDILAREITAPTGAPPPWDDFEWRIATAVASMQGMSSILLDVLRWRGPDGWRSFLEEQRGHIGRRHQKIVDLL